MYFHEYFSKNQKFALEEWLEVIGVRRELRFKAKRRQDGMVKREEIFGKKIVEYYSDRPDRLLKRLIELAPKEIRNECQRPFLPLSGDDFAVRKAVARIE